MVKEKSKGKCLEKVQTFSLKLNERMSKMFSWEFFITSNPRAVFKTLSKIYDGELLWK